MLVILVAALVAASFFSGRANALFDQSCASSSTSITLGGTYCTGMAECGEPDGPFDDLIAWDVQRAVGEGCEGCLYGGTGCEATIQEFGGSVTVTVSILDCDPPCEVLCRWQVCRTYSNYEVSQVCGICEYPL